MREQLDSSVFIEKRHDLAKKKQRTRVTLFALTDWLTLGEYADLFVASTSTFSEVSVAAPMPQADPVAPPRGFERPTATDRRIDCRAASAA